MFDGEDEIKKEKRELTCRLTDEEVNAYAKELARNQEEKYEMEGRKKEIMSEFTANINRFDSHIAVLARKVHSGQETRQVECWYDYNWADNEKALYRADTGELVKIEEIEGWEKQRHLKLREKEEEGRSGKPLTEDVPSKEESDYECPDCRSPEEDIHGEGCPSIDVLEDKEEEDR